MAVQVVEDWVDEEGLFMIECWSRDGYTLQEIADRIGISLDGLQRWRRKYEVVDKALKKGREYTNYQVENAMLKAALGYKTDEVMVRTTMRHGKVIETVTTNTTKEFAPNVRAAETWLYNKDPKNWKKNRDDTLELLDASEGVQVLIKRAKRDEDDDDVNEQVDQVIPGPPEEYEEWDDEDE